MFKMNQNVQETEIIPLVTDFVQYYPWSCYQLELHVDVYVEKVSVQGVISDKSTLHLKSPTLEIKERLKNMTQQSVLRLPSFKSVEDVETDKNANKSKLKDTKKKAAEVQIKAVYNKENILIELNFIKCSKSASEKLFKILQYIIPYYPYLSGIIVKQNITASAIYQISKLLKISNITEVSLDGCTVKEGNYYVLVQEHTKLNRLSLARCSIDDEILQALATNLSHPHSASRTLNILNLSSNNITDEGAKMLAEILRTNRHLYYINIADNKITDDGAFAILDTFLEFSLDVKEQEDFRKRHWDFVKRKNELIQKFVTDLKNEEEESNTKKVGNTLEKEGSIKKAGKFETEKMKQKSKGKIKTIFHQIDIKEKAMKMTEKLLADHEEPFDNVYKKYDILHYPGNHTVRILNLAYNNITYLSLKKLLKVLEHQRLLNRDPVGLVNVCIEGNYLPKNCVEFQMIDDILNKNMPVTKSLKKRNINSARSSITNTSK